MRINLFIRVHRSSELIILFHKVSKRSLQYIIRLFLVNLFKLIGNTLYGAPTASLTIQNLQGGTFARFVCQSVNSSGMKEWRKCEAARLFRVA